MKVESSTMEDLPAEMVVKIFDFLDCESMKKASTICKDWRNFIFSSQKLMNRFTLKVHNFEEQKSFLEKFGMSFRKVRATSNMSLENGNPSYKHKNLVDFLKIIGNVETLEICRIKMTFRAKKMVNINLPNLKNVKLCNLANTYRVSNLLGSAKLQELTMDVERTCNCFDEDFLNWLCDQDQLKSLTFLGASLTMFLHRLEYNFNRITFNLKKLYLKTDGIRVVGNFESLFNFLCQQNDIEELIFDKRLDNSNENLWTKIMKQVLRNCSKLKHLEFRGAFSFKGDDIREFVSNRLETLIFKTSPHFPTLQLIKLAPNLKHLDITFDWNFSRIPLKEFMFFLTNNTPNLEVLKITKFYLSQEEHYANLKLPNLKELSLVSTSISHSNWKSIIDKCPNIEKLHLEYFAITTQSLAMITQQLKHFKELDLGCGVYDPNLLEVLETCPQFTRLIVSPEMKNQFNNILENAEFEVVVKENLDNPFLRADYPGMAFNSFKSDNKRLIDFVGYSNNFTDYAIQMGVHI